MIKNPGARNQACTMEVSFRDNFAASGWKYFHSKGGIHEVEGFKEIIIYFYRFSVKHGCIRQCNGDAEKNH